MLKTKIVYLKKIYKFCYDHFLYKLTVFILIKKTLLKIKSCGFYKFYFDHFLIGIIVFLINMKNAIK